MTAQFKKGFTLIELLIVMAILGVLAVVVLVAINPAEQMRRARDTGRISGTQQLGRAIQAYYTGNGCLPGIVGTAPCPATASVITDLTTSQELSVIPAAISTTEVTTCPAGGQPIPAANPSWCYIPSAPSTFVVFSTLVSQQRVAGCPAGTQPPQSIFSSTASRGGIFCGVPAANSVPI